jgi:uncharacterized membrane protein
MGETAQPEDFEEPVVDEVDERDDQRVLAVIAHFLPFPLEASILFVDDFTDRPVTPFLRYHVLHSLVYSIGAIAFPLVMAVLVYGGFFVALVFFSTETIPYGIGMGGLVGIVLASAAFALIVGFLIWIYLVWSAFRGKTPTIPIMTRISSALGKSL